MTTPWQLARAVIVVIAALVMKYGFAFEAWSVFMVCLVLFLVLDFGPRRRERSRKALD